MNAWSASGHPTLRANKSETFDCLKFTLEDFTRQMKRLPVALRKSMT